MEENNQNELDLIKNKITMKEFVESEEVLKLYNKEKDKYKIYTILPLICIFISILTTIIILISTDGKPSLELVILYVSFYIITLAVIITCSVSKGKNLDVYKQLLEIAQKNDEIRHNEKVRYLERKRLNAGLFDNENNIKNITKTLKDKITLPEENEQKQ